ncbi:zinc metalloprotease HtpX [Weissella viridescens]|jgi:heat shock protein HtpX|uniref:zinc metalloprotease HtpX n=1 Tax=Weissella viridescens TaxID=1629 RepID=UPI0011423279|nr:zinc metalloprotease HtpX [Weissella viridescens]MBX4172072.1 zinc metalloprotease HtpX [Weissella viridescens]MCB6839692.1 zinc metalloprotease HtpX [Weissella viridescens]MCB6846424.1 zinc metalloprotease HtpX [Weissella viridescens]WJI90854.1 zinc metalloprotease HtpX [Weissella viridescens]GEA94747.1 protease HtpX [Weissella viridescens]
MLFEQIAQNKRKTVILIFGFFLFTAIVGAALGYFLMASWSAGVLIALVAGGVYAFYMMSQSTDVVMSMNHGHEITTAEQAPELWHIVEDMALVANVPMPRVFIIDDSSPNAFATGNKPENAAVAATVGILQKLNREELEGVMAHEMTHVRNYDIRIQTLAVALTSVITMLANFGTSFWGWSSRDRDNQSSNIFGIVMAVIVMMLAPLAATIIQLAISRNREFLADAGAVELTRNPQGLIDALTKISGSEPMAEENVAPSSAGLYIGDPLKKESRMSHLFDTHPPMEERIAALRQM